MKRRRPKLRVGDVFTLPADQDGTRVGYGQIVGRWAEAEMVFYFAIFDGVHPADEAPDIETAVSRPLALLAPAMDALLYNGSWRVVGQHDVDETRIPWPAYKESVSAGGNYEVVDALGTRRRKATRKEAKVLPFRDVVSPKVIELAFQALNGSGEWNAEWFDGLRPVAPELTSAAVFD